MNKVVYKGLLILAIRSLSVRLYLRILLLLVACVDELQLKTT